MKLLNFSIGTIQTVQIGTEPIKTAHVKAPVVEPWIVTDDGARGDQRAVHPDKIYAFPRSGYAFWGEYLKVDPARWPDGFFGENLTLDVLDETDVRVGDIFSLGDEVRLFVAGSRNPCVKLAWRLAQPRTFQKIFALSQHTGVYLGVAVPGTVRPGDQLVRIHHDPTMPSIADVCAFVADHNPPPLEPLRRLLAFEKLSITNRLLLGAKLDDAERAAELVDGRWRGWRRFVVDRVVEEAHDVRSVYLRATDGERLCQPRPGQFVTARVTDPLGTQVTRPWSLSAFGYDLDHYRLTVRRTEGSGSGWIHGASVGSEVDLRAPSGKFVLDMGGFRPVVLVAAGIGVTPLLAMLQAHLKRPQGGPIYLLYGARTPETLSFRDEIAELAAGRDDVRVKIVYSQSAIGGPPQRIGPELLISFLADLHIVLADGHRVDLPWYESDMYLCGPGDFCAAMTRDLVAAGANADHIHFESFTAMEASATELEVAEVSFGRSGCKATWRAGDDLSLLELAENAGIEIDSDCRAGACLTCRTMISAGTTSADTGEGFALLCIARPTTSRVTIDV